jgi:Protein of unknown function (DUF3102)
MAQLERLDTLAERINEEHRKVEAAMGRALQHARRAGKLLVEAKERTYHGEWLPWLKANFEGSERTAQMYMRVHSRWPEIEANTKSVSYLTLTGALGAIGPPQEADVTRERFGGPLRWAGVEAGEEPTEPREQLKGERSEDKDDYDYAQSLMAKVKEGGEEIEKIVRIPVAVYVVKRKDGKTMRVARKVLLETGWKKCSCCDGYGITNSA